MELEVEDKENMDTYLEEDYLFIGHLSISKSFSSCVNML